MEIKVEPKTNGTAKKTIETPQEYLTLIEKQRIKDNIRLNYSVIYEVLSTMELTNIMDSVWLEKPNKKKKTPGNRIMKCKNNDTEIRERKHLNVNEVIKCRNTGIAPSDEDAELLAVLFHLPFLIMSGEERIYLGLEIKDKWLLKDSHSLPEMYDKANKIEHEEKEWTLGISDIANEFIDREPYEGDSEYGKTEVALFSGNYKFTLFDNIKISEGHKKHSDAESNRLVRRIIGNPTNINPLAILMNIYTGGSDFNINDAELIKYLQRKEKEFIKKFKWNQLKGGYSPIFSQSNIQVGEKERYLYVLVKITNGKMFSPTCTFDIIYEKELPEILTTKLMGELDSLLNPVIEENGAKANNSNFIYSLDSIIKGLAFSSYKPAARMKHTYKECMVLFEAADGESSINNKNVNPAWAIREKRRAEQYKKLKEQKEYINNIIIDEYDIDSPNYIDIDIDIDTVAILKEKMDRLLELQLEVQNIAINGDDIDSPDYIDIENPETPTERIVRITREVKDIRTSDDDIDSPDFIDTGEPETPEEKLVRLTQEIWDMKTSDDDIDSPDFVYTGEPEDTDGVLPYPLIINRDSDLFNLVYYMKQLYSVAIMGQSTKKKGELVDIVDSSNLKGRDLAAEKAALKQKISQAKKGKPRAAKAATQATQATAATKTPNIQ